VPVCCWQRLQLGVAVCVVVFWYCVCARSRVCVCYCVQRDGSTALYQASANGKEEVVEVLVTSGAAVNAAEVRRAVCDEEWFLCERQWGSFMK
jgi:hypothetical protein